MTLEATRAFYPDKNNKGDPSKTYARIFGKDGFMEVESPHSSPETPLKVEPEENNHSIPTYFSRFLYGWVIVLLRMVAL